MDKKINYQMILALVIHAFFTLIFLLDEEYPFIGFITLPFLLSNILGVIFVATNKPMIGARIFLVGCLAFIPIGLIGIFGARKIMDDCNRENFRNS